MTEFLLDCDKLFKPRRQSLGNLLQDDLFATKQKVANLAGGMRTPAQSNEFLSSIAKDDEMARYVNFKQNSKYSKCLFYVSTKAPLISHVTAKLRTTKSDYSFIIFDQTW